MKNNLNLNDSVVSPIHIFEMNIFCFFSNLLHEEPNKLLVSYPHVYSRVYAWTEIWTQIQLSYFTIKEEDTCHETFSLPYLQEQSTGSHISLPVLFLALYSTLLAYLAFLCSSFSYTSSTVKAFHFSEISLFYIVLVIHIFKLYPDWLFYQVDLCGYIEIFVFFLGLNEIKGYLGTEEGSCWLHFWRLQEEEGFGKWMSFFVTDGWVGTECIITPACHHLPHGTNSFCVWECFFLGRGCMPE